MIELLVCLAFPLAQIALLGVQGGPQDEKGLRQMKLRAKFKNEIERFERCCDGAAPTLTGLHQFHAHESKGTKPQEPDPYYQRLLNGKRWWEWTVNEYASLYESWEWWGWAMLEQDFKNDPAGLKQIRDRIGLWLGHVSEPVTRRSASAH